MALKGSLTLYARNKLLANLWGKTPYTQPDPVYFAVHLATTLSAGYSSGGSTISTVAHISAGANIIVAPFYAGATDLNAEQHVVLSVTGSGPYTVTLVDTLSHNHLSGAYVAFDPGVDCADILEPVGNNYSRASLVNNTSNFPAPSGGESDSAVEIPWPTPSASWTLATHAIALDSATAGIAWSYHPMQSFVIFDTSTNPPKLGVGNFITRANTPS